VRIESSTVSFNICTESSTHAVYVHGASGGLLMDDCVVEHNTSGGVAFASSNGGPAAVITNSKFRWNTPSGPGGTVCTNGSSIVIAGCTFEGNKSLTGGGGAVGAVGAGNLTVLDSEFIDNVSAGSGGAIGSGAQGMTRIERCRFALNRSNGTSESTGGGALMLPAGSPWAVLDCEFEYNFAFAEGGAIFCAGASAVAGERRIANCSFFRNAARRGGAISTLYLQGSIEGCDFVRNESVATGSAAFPIHGGALHILGQAALVATVSNSRFVGNTTDGSGGAISIQSNGPTPLPSQLVNLTIVGNTAYDGAGGGITQIGTAPALISNAILWMNESSAEGQDDQLGGTGNISSDPLFVQMPGRDGLIGTTDDNLRLTAASPCVDTGADLPASCTLDLDYAARFAGRTIDRGAYEFGARPMPDCDGDHREDACALATGLASDCNSNGMVDLCEARGPVFDCDANGVFDGCSVLPDCNGDGQPDVCAVRGGAPDCNGNGIPDDCDIAAGAPDCNGNGAPDSCDLASGSSADVDGDGVPDECRDCDGNGVLDVIDIANGASDCNADGVLDTCQPDCDGNGTPDDCDLASGTLRDLDRNGVPDVCQADCNNSGIPDFLEILFGTSLDCNDDGIPDECQLDCNGNGVPDDCDIADGASDDCDRNGVPDGCDIATGTHRDLNGNGTPDVCEQDCDGNGLPDFLDLVFGTATDCNSNGVPDSCDLEAGAPDCDRNGIPDACDIASGAVDCDLDGVPDLCQVTAGAPDCNNNGKLDSCEVGLPFVAVSPQLSPFGFTSPQTIIIDPAFPTAEPVSITVQAVSDLSSSVESVALLLDGQFVMTLFGPTGTDCPVIADTVTITIPVVTWNTHIGDGAIALSFNPSSSVSATQCALSYVQATVSYVRPATTPDANQNGVLTNASSPVISTETAWWAPRTSRSCSACGGRVRTASRTSTATAAWMQLISPFFFPDGLKCSGTHHASARHLSRSSAAWPSPSPPLREQAASSTSTGRHRPVETV